MMFTKEGLEKLGFTGFTKINDIENNFTVFPNKKGVYIILMEEGQSISFRNPGMGGFFHNQNPNVSIETL